MGFPYTIVVTDFSEQPISPIFKSQAVKENLLGLGGPWRWDWYAVPKCWKLPPNLRCVTLQKTRNLNC